MPDPIKLAFASVNVFISLLGLVLVLMGIRRWKTGLLAKTLKRAAPTGILLFLFFVTEALIALDMLPHDAPIGDILSTLFMLDLLYVTYGFVNDWTHLDSAIKAD